MKLVLSFYGQDRIWAGLGGRTLGVYQALTALVTCNIAITELVAMLGKTVPSVTGLSDLVLGWLAMTSRDIWFGS